MGHVIAVITRSGRGHNAPTSSGRRLVDEDQVMQEEEIPNNIVQLNEKIRIDIDDMQKAKALFPKPPPPCPQRLAKQNGENQFKKFIQMMKSLSINVPLAEAWEQMPSYAEFMKDLVTKKRSMNFETIKVSHQVSAIVHSMAPKLEDPDAFMIPYFGNWEIETYLYEIANRRSYYEKAVGVIEDVLVRVDKFILLADFVILDCEAVCDVEDGELTFRVGDENVVFYVCKSMQQPNSNEVCSFVDLVTDVIVDDTSAIINVGDILETILLNFDDNEMDGFMECVNSMQGMGSGNYAPRKLSLDVENWKTSHTKPSFEEPPTLELNPLPPHLRNKFLGPCSTLPVILSSCLTNVQVDSTLAVLEKRKEAIGWTLADIWGISPTFCMHKIKLEDGAKPYIEHQRRLNESICEGTNLVLNWEKCHFMVEEGIVLGRKISRNGIEVDKEAFEVISKHPPSTSVKGLRSFLDHAGYYRHFIKDFSKVMNPLCNLLEKDDRFNFNDKCMRAFEFLKPKFTTIPIITAPNWSVPFKLICDASDEAVGGVLGQCINKIFHLVYYANKIMNSAQVNYAITEK
uniref:Uncharacterized protein LOC104226315 n=1 Tax=Nicotiana sylvestris TaxID=4096 RepID=A0A1U7WQQ2_NICSY|nr:PREDICTED: uncharacterized protein LOC104226315 [Nicotiana sylvestris]